MTNPSRLPLTGVKVLDLTHEIAGPTCTMYLGDMGAEIWKIERVGLGDDTRHWLGWESSVFVALNRNKSSICLNLKTQEGRRICLKLAKRADVLVENFGPGVIDRLGLGYKEVTKVNPRIVYCSISGYGKAGPYADQDAWDPVVQAATGLLYLTGLSSGVTRIPASILDQEAGLTAAYAIVAALLARRKLKRVERIDVSLFDVAVANLLYFIPYIRKTREQVHPQGPGIKTWYPYGLFESADKDVYIAVNNNEKWKNFCAALALGGLVDDRRFRTNEMRVKNKAVLETVVNRATGKMRSSEVVWRLAAAKVPCAPLNTPNEVLHHPQVKANRTLVNLGFAGRQTLVAGLPIRFSGRLRMALGDPPRLSKDTRRILESVGIGRKKIPRLIREGVISG